MNTEIPNKMQKIGFHSHLNTKKADMPFFTQPVMQKSFEIIKKFIQKNYTGKLILLKGPPSTGKTAFIYTLKNDLSPDLNFNLINASEIYSKTMSKIEFLTQAIRKSIGLTIKDSIRVIEGEVVTLSNERLTLKTLDMESTFDIGEQMLLQIQKEKISVGDIIRIVKERGNILKIGISSSKKTQDFLSDVGVVNCPEGEMFKFIEENQKISLHDIDVINYKVYGAFRLFNGETGEISSDVREEVDEIVRKWILEEKAKIQRGVLCIEDAHMLDNECLNLLVQSVEFGRSPLIILTTSVENIENFPKSMLVMSTSEFKEKDIKNILTEIINSENIQLDEIALNFLVNLSMQKGISFSKNIIHISKIYCSTKNSEILKIDDIKKTMEFFCNYCDI